MKDLDRQLTVGFRSTSAIVYVCTDHLSVPASINIASKPTTAILTLHIACPMLSEPAWGSARDQRLRGFKEEEVENSPRLPRPARAVNGDGAIILGDQIFGYPKSQTSASDAFGGVERFEEVAHRFCVHSGTGIRDEYPNTHLARLLIPTRMRTKGKPSARSHGIVGVRNEVN